jgi:hypothetical protein
MQSSVRSALSPETIGRQDFPLLTRLPDFVFGVQFLEPIDDGRACTRGPQ